MTSATAASRGVIAAVTTTCVMVWAIVLLIGEARGRTPTSLARLPSVGARFAVYRFTGARSNLPADLVDGDAAVVDDDHRIFDGAEIRDGIAVQNDQVGF